MQKITADLSELKQPFDDGKPAQRVETGPLQINSDWPGVFIRGDNALNYSMQLSRVLDQLDDSTQAIDKLAIYSVKSLVDTLRGCAIMIEDENISNDMDVADQEVGC